MENQNLVLSEPPHPSSYHLSQLLCVSCPLGSGGAGGRGKAVLSAGTQHLLETPISVDVVEQFDSVISAAHVRAFVY